jgi:hypothetical protein
MIGFVFVRGVEKMENFAIKDALLEKHLLGQTFKAK